MSSVHASLAQLQVKPPLPGTSAYARLAQLRFPSARLVASTGKYIVIDAKSFLRVEMTLNMLDAVK